MKGMAALIAVRQQGFKPQSMVWVTDDPINAWQTDWLAEESSPTICTHGVPLHEIDFRPLVGLTVSLDGVAQDRVKKLAGEAKRAGAVAIVATSGEFGSYWNKELGKWLSF